MRKLILATLAATSAFAALPAAAQDAAPFTGFRAEGLVGWNQLKADGGHDDGVGYGFAAGYDRALGDRVIVGLEGEISDSSNKECSTFASAVDSLCYRTGRDLYAGARIGTPLTPNLLLYGKAGYTNARYKVSYDDGVSGAGNFRDSSNLDGVRVGAGLEYAITPQAYVKTEYRYSNWEAGLSQHQALAGAGFRF
jgi:outer membrane immunogenic protein